MTDTTAKPATVKQEPTAATYNRTALVAALAASPIALGDVIHWLMTIVQAAWGAFPVPPDATCTNIAILLAAGGAGAASYSVRGTRDERRSTDPD